MYLNIILILLILTVVFNLQFCSGLLIGFIICVYLSYGEFIKLENNIKILEHKAKNRLTIVYKKRCKKPSNTIDK